MLKAGSNSGLICSIIGPSGANRPPEPDWIHKFGGSRDSLHIEQTARVEGRRRVRFEALKNSDLSVRMMLSMLADELPFIVACK